LKTSDSSDMRKRLKDASDILLCDLRVSSLSNLWIIATHSLSVGSGKRISLRRSSRWKRLRNSFREAASMYPCEARGEMALNISSRSGRSMMMFSMSS
jgi:hypothetical protein